MQRAQWIRNSMRNCKELQESLFLLSDTAITAAALAIQYVFVSRWNIDYHKLFNFCFILFIYIYLILFTDKGYDELFQQSWE